MSNSIGVRQVYTMKIYLYWNPLTMQIEVIEKNAKPLGVPYLIGSINKTDTTVGDWTK